MWSRVWLSNIFTPFSLFLKKYTDRVSDITKSRPSSKLVYHFQQSKLKNLSQYDRSHKFNKVIVYYLM